MSALAHQIAGLLAVGWTEAEIRAALATAVDAPGAADAGAQERRWRDAPGTSATNGSGPPANRRRGKPGGPETAEGPAPLSRGSALPP
ncbi:hypothetical protein [Actinoplanes teichomyceticus]|uniref:Uncharacterized protein n=1 Tax=Actinoplanes teichomyceticus TaxID=1867 RepID=A0A561VLV6_ACTTI|nr:hypothetical protein [Actinoplanes teichomyceticus]TWG12601.1 hypothetical protein FHX34_105468 [Actinoplanes teichomyceticus]GIF13968.1 hypothetical protein Ate01nite_40000 [Actinoplanes teichomyceticus]